MCGRTAQTIRAVGSARASLRGRQQQRRRNNVGAAAIRGGGSDEASTADDDRVGGGGSVAEALPSGEDHFNLSPGMDALVFWMDNESDEKEMRVDMKTWGLVPRGGTETLPLQTGPKLHFSNLMFNARSDTLYDKPTFSKLALQGRTCVIAVDGYFEWKASELPGGKKGRKQPYFVHRTRNHNPVSKKEGSEEMNSVDDKGYLLIAGLWTRVKTGRSEKPFLDTFTMLTTDACPSLRWLHHRMPVCIWDETLALEWLTQPSKDIHKQIEVQSRETQSGIFGCHMVTKEMSSVGFRGPAAIVEIPKPQSISSFFPVKEEAKPILGKRATPDTASSSEAKRPKKGSIESFFAPKKI